MPPGNNLGRGYRVIAVGATNHQIQIKMKVKPIKIENPNDVADTAYRIAEVIADCASEARATSKQLKKDAPATESYSPHSSEVDNLSKEETKALIASDEFNKFSALLTEKVREVENLIQEYSPKYNCAIFMSLTFLDNPHSTHCGLSMHGNAEALKSGFVRNWNANPELSELFLEIQLRRMFLQSKSGK